MGVLFKLSYNLRRFQAAGWSLERCLAGILLLLGLLGLLRWLPGGWLSVGAAASGLGVWIGTFLSSRDARCDGLYHAPFALAADSA